jgi:hypothetical protein
VARENSWVTEFGKIAIKGGKFQCVIGLVLAESYLEKFGCDTLLEILEQLEEYKKFSATY